MSEIPRQRGVMICEDGLEVGSSVLYLAGHCRKIWVVEILKFSGFKKVNKKKKVSFLLFLISFSTSIPCFDYIVHTVRESIEYNLYRTH